MKHIPPVLLVNPLKEDKIIDRIARCNRKTYGGSYELVELKKWIKEIEKIFTIIKVPKKKKVNSIGTFYLTRKADIWRSTVKNRFVGPEFIWSKFLQELRAKFNYNSTAEREGIY